MGLGASGPCGRWFESSRPDLIGHQAHCPPWQWAFLVVCQCLAPIVQPAVWVREGVTKIGRPWGNHRKLFVTRRFRSSNPVTSFAEPRRLKERFKSARAHRCETMKEA